MIRMYKNNVLEGEKEFLDALSKPLNVYEPVIKYFDRVFDRKLEELKQKYVTQ